jgi:hypothetical protein
MEVYCIEGQENLPAHNSPVITGKVYEVAEVSKCGCGTDIYDVGLLYSVVCATRCNCGRVIPGPTAWKRASRFIPIDNIDVSELVELTEEIFV